MRRVSTASKMYMPEQYHSCHSFWRLSTSRGTQGEKSVTVGSEDYPSSVGEKLPCPTLSDHAQTHDQSRSLTRRSDLVRRRVGLCEWLSHASLRPFQWRDFSCQLETTDKRVVNFGKVYGRGPRSYLSRVCYSVLVMVR